MNIRRQILTPKVNPCTKRVTFLYWLYTQSIDIQIKRRKLAKTFMMILKWKNPLVPIVFKEIFQVVNFYHEFAAGIPSFQRKIFHFKKLGPFGYFWKHVAS